MHWLYSDADSIRALDEAGFLYDSTLGYNGAVGFRTGTTQAFKPAASNRMLELPLHIMDTALFYPGRMNLTSQEAWQRVLPILESSARFGGVLTINWHDRSIAPERLWGDFYNRLLDWIEDREPWFATASQAVCWFERRRSTTFEVTERLDASTRVRVKVPSGTDLTPMRLRFHLPTGAETFLSHGANSSHQDFVLNSDMDITIPAAAEKTSQP